ncbi:rhodanese-like domain-containing protein [Fibrobacter sp.]|jgi:rhodanese-related sulfurtransferase|uniref:rhodanese-like domain-containing protein n=1 Tax=Fibrobacter sp. TaxID=35828 RepID=UPI0026029D85|nr:rhodanese-like domain-containing protein [Fibrobacter sp.]MDD5941919.1 rhodanese-like domain-containing protein [Fibrobacter sp.]
MKKLMLIAVSALFMMAGCEENKSEKAADVKTAAPAVVNQTVSATQQVAEQNAIKSIDWNKALEMNAAGAVFVDVRNPPELNEGYAPNAVNIPLPELKQRVGELPKDKDLLIYCRSGRRSEAATRILMEQGYDRVYNVLGGYLAFPKK